MKKLLALALILILALSLAACGNITINLGGSDNIETPYVPPENTPAAEAPTDDGGITLAALEQAVQDLGFETRDDYMTAFSATIEPQDGFTASYISDGYYDIPFFEFRSNAEALAYKAENDEPDAMFPHEHIVIGRFAAELTILSEAGGMDCKQFIEHVFEMAGANAGTPAENVNDTPGGNDTPNGGELTLDALKNAVHELGFETRDDLFFGMFSSIKPQNGFLAEYQSASVSSDISILEFKSNAEALAYKAENDEPDAMFPKEHFVFGRFAAENTILSESVGAECQKFIETVFAKAGWKGN